MFRRGALLRMTGMGAGYRDLTREPVGFDRQEFRNSTIRGKLREAQGHYGSTIWLSDAQLRLARISARPKEVPIQVAGKGKVAVHRFFNAEQLSDPSAITDQRPQYIDGEPIYGLDAVTLAREQPPVAADEPVPNRWYTVPDGLAKAGLMRKQNGRIVQRVMGFGDTRRGVLLVSEADTQPAEPGRMASTAPVETTAKESEPNEGWHPAHECAADPDVAFDAATIFTPTDEAALDGAAVQEPDSGPVPNLQDVFHRSGTNGKVYSTGVQQALNRVMERHKYRTRVWYNAQRLPLGASIKPSATTHIIGQGTGNAPLALINEADLTINDAATTAADSTDTALRHVSGKTGRLFREQAQKTLSDIAAEHNYVSCVWWSVSSVPRTPKLGQTAHRVVLSDSPVFFYNDEQLEAAVAADDAPPGGAEQAPEQ